MSSAKKKGLNRKIIAVCGKGGAGKTAVAAMMTAAIKRLEPKSRTLLIDADPAGGLASAMGVKAHKTIGEIREGVLKQARTKDPAIKEQVARAVDYYLLDALEERDGWSLLAMGRGESAGCFCPVNNLLRDAIGTLAGDFNRVIIDGEAGIEQIMRQVMKTVDTLLVVSDSSARGINTASLIRSLVKGKGVLSSPELLLIINRVVDNKKVRNIAAENGFEIAALVPEDDLIGKWDASSKPLSELPPNAESMKAISKLVKKLFTE